MLAPRVGDFDQALTRVMGWALQCSILLLILTSLSTEMVRVSLVNQVPPRGQAVCIKRPVNLLGAHQQQNDHFRLSADPV